MNPTPDGPKYPPLPARTPGETRKTGAVYREAGIQIPPAAVAMLAIVFSGAGIWFAGARGTAPPAPAAAIAPRLAAPAPLTPTFPAVVSESPAPFADGVSYAPSPTATDEMPMAATPNSGMVNYGTPVPPQPPTAVAPQAAPKPCPLCDRAQGPLGAVVVNERTLKNVTPSDLIGVQVAIVGNGGTVRVDYVGPCTEGFLYRLTNTLDRPLGPMAVAGTNYSYWKIKALGPGESVEIRSPSSILGISYKSL